MLRTWSSWEWLKQSRAMVQYLGRSGVAGGTPSKIPVELGVAGCSSRKGTYNTLLVKENMNQKPVAPRS